MSKPILNIMLPVSLVVLGLIYGCKKTDSALTPTVTTQEVTEVTDRSARCGGNVSSDGNSEVITRGVVWGYSGEPTLENAIGFTTDGAGTGSFSSAMNELNDNTTYYVRAYATNNVGTSYGDTEVFQTLKDTYVDPSKPSGLIISPKSARIGEAVAISFSGGNAFTFSQASTTCPEIWAYAILHFDQGSPTIIYPFAINFVSNKQFDAFFDIPSYVPTGVYNVVLAPNTPCTHTEVRAFSISN